MDRDEDWLPAEAWAKASQPPGPHANSYVTVYDTDMGCLVEMTTPDGQVFYGFDPARP